MSRSWQDEIAVAIPSINGGRLLARMLPTLQFKLANVIVLDQGSTDETEDVCSTYGTALVQLGVPHTYTQACNIGATIATERGCKYVCVSNNDIVFRNNVLLDLYTEMERDPKLGIIAPGQIIVEEAANRQILTSRAMWNLNTVDFMHDVGPIEDGVLRLESDFCELTCALVRLSAIEQVGFLDDDYGFYHEDADFGFRLRKSGYECAYLPRTQIEHFHGTTFRQDKVDRRNSYIWKNKSLFAQRHLGIGVNHVPHPIVSGDDREVLSAHLHSYLHRFGMVDATSPELLMAYPGVEFSDYLYTNLNVRSVSTRWTSLAKKYRALFTTTEHMRAQFEGLGVHSFHVPAGIEPDFFHIWGPRVRPYDETTYLAIIDGSDPALSRTIEAWSSFAPYRNAHLIILGRDMGECIGGRANSVSRSDDVDIERYLEEKVDVYRILAPLSSPALARIFRSVDYVILGSGGDTSLAALGAMASGLPPIFAGGGPPGIAPSENVLKRLIETYALSAAERAALSRAASDTVRGHSTLRHTTMGLYSALAQLQARDPGKILVDLSKRRPSILPSPTVDAPVISAPSAPLVVRPASRFRLRGARLLRAVAYLMDLFGQVWRDRGLRAAVRLSVDRLRRLSRRLAGRLKQKAGIGGRLAVPETPVPAAAGVSGVVPRSALLIGYIDGQLGLGQSLRGLALSMSKSAINFAIYPFGVGVEGRRMAPYMPERYDLTHAHEVNIIEVTPDELPNVYAHISKRHFNRSYNILRTYWELGQAPEAWRSRLAKIDEIWAPSTFISESFRPIFDGKITHVPPCVDLVAPSTGRDYFDLSKGCFYFLYSFDYYSLPERKNPLGVLRAFRAAFPDPATPVGLIIKATGAANHSVQLRDELRTAARNDPRIQIVDESLLREDMAALMSAADCYVSLHRSEGFGLGMAESMLLSKPVIGTNYSGNTDFLSEKTGYPIPYSLRPVNPGEYVHIENQVWADPDEDACAIAMRSVVGDPDEAARRAVAGQRIIQEKYGYAAVSEIVERRLNEIFEGGRRPPASL